MRFRSALVDLPGNSLPGYANEVLPGLSTMRPGPKTNSIRSNIVMTFTRIGAGGPPSVRVAACRCAPGFVWVWRDVSPNGPRSLSIKEYSAKQVRDVGQGDGDGDGRTGKWIATNCNRF